MSSSRYYSRGGGRTRGTGTDMGRADTWGRGRGPGFFRRTPPPQHSAPLGAIIDTINSNKLLPEVENPQIKGVQYVASYNWLDVKEPVVLVPGAPPAWTPPLKHYHLNPDSVPVYRDINAARFPSFPLEPAVRSIFLLNPDIDLDAIDVVGCGSTIGNLLRFAGSISKPFRFDVDVVGGAVFFIRKEISPTEMITDLAGYGHTFPERYTAWNHDVRNSCSHQRIIQYDFGGLRFLLRSETDAYIPNTDPGIPSEPEKSPTLVSSMETLNISTSKQSPESKLQIERHSTLVPQSQIFDIKTRSSSNVFDMEDILPRLWVSQTPKFLIAYHQRGLFSKPKIRDVRKEVRDWEAQNAARLGRFHALVRRIVDVVTDDGNEQAEVSWDGQGPLLITKQTGEKRRVLPSDLLQRWEDK